MKLDAAFPEVFYFHLGVVRIVDYKHFICYLVKQSPLYDAAICDESNELSQILPLGALHFFTGVGRELAKSGELSIVEPMLHSSIYILLNLLYVHGISDTSLPALDEGGHSNLKEDDKKMAVSFFAAINPSITSSIITWSFDDLVFLECGINFAANLAMQYIPETHYYAHSDYLADLVASGALGLCASLTLGSHDVSTLRAMIAIPYCISVAAATHKIAHAISEASLSVVENVYDNLIPVLSDTLELMGWSQNLTEEL